MWIIGAGGLTSILMIISLFVCWTIYSPARRGEKEPRKMETLLWHLDISLSFETSWQARREHLLRQVHFEWRIDTTIRCTVQLINHCKMVVSKIRLVLLKIKDPPGSHGPEQWHRQCHHTQLLTLSPTKVLQKSKVYFFLTKVTYWPTNAQIFAVTDKKNPEEKWHTLIISKMVGLCVLYEWLCFSPWGSKRSSSMREIGCF